MLDQHEAHHLIPQPEQVEARGITPLDQRLGVRMRRVDLLLALIYPLYQIVGTLRHEASHAVVAVLEGARIERFVFWPTIRDGLGFSWGYVQWSGDVGWPAIAAPYVCDLITYVIFWIICVTVPFPRRWVWLNAAIVGLVSPLVNSLYNYLGYRGSNDVGRLLMFLPSGVVHLWFLVSLAVYAVGVRGAFRLARNHWDH